MTEPSATKEIVTHKNALISFYDIESLSNVFTLCTFSPRTGIVEVYYLIENDGGILAQTPIDLAKLAQRIQEKNPAWKGLTEDAPKDTLVKHGLGAHVIEVLDLSLWESNVRLAQTFGASTLDVNRDQNTGYDPSFRIVCDTDTEIYDPINTHPYYAGYNSYNYDTTMLSLYLWEALASYKSVTANGGQTFSPPKPSQLREYNDTIFDQYIRNMPNFLTEDHRMGGKRWANLPHKLRQNMLMSGRHIDIARLNEKQTKVGQKRLLGGLGRQILESDNLGTHNNYVKDAEEFYDLIGYNVSDVIGLHKLFQHRIYSGAFDLKKGLLDQYPEAIYDETTKGSYKPAVRKDKVRRNRLRIDSTSAQFVGRILSPYGHLTDMEFVSFMYPSERVAKERNVERVNVLEETKKFFYENISDPKARRQFDNVYAYYKSIEGKNFNDSEEYAQAYGKDESSDYDFNSYENRHIEPEEDIHKAYVLKEMPKRPLNIPYFKADGSPSSCFASFSTGGIHGAEANEALYLSDVAKYKSHIAMFETAKRFYPEAPALMVELKRQNDLVTLENGLNLRKSLVVLGSDPEKVKWRKPKKATAKKPLEKEDEITNMQILIAKAMLAEPADVLKAMRPESMRKTVVAPDGTNIDISVVLDKTTLTGATYRDEVKTKEPEMFPITENGDGSAHNRFSPRYTFTSSEAVIHEDFTSYYPNMLRNLSAFYNERLGTDRYAKILDDKDRYGKMMKDPATPPEEKALLAVMREGTKLILNSASGAGDTNFTGQPIRVNNAIISMRLLGQMFSWRIGQAQTLVGARIISTNTDGLYSVLDEETNNRVLKEQAALINVEIEPEPMVIVSKDSNNRLELSPSEKDPTGWEFHAAGGGSLACHREPQPDKSLAHPAVLDWALARYLRSIAIGITPEWREGKPYDLTEDMDRDYVMQILTEATQLEDKILVARLFQNIVSASSGKITFPFASKFLDPDNPTPEGATEHRNLQHYNRVFYVKKGNPESVSIRAAGAWSVTPAQKATRERMGIEMIHNDTLAMQILRKEGFIRTRAELSNHPGAKLLPSDQDTAVRKVSGIDPSWPVIIDNDDLWEKGDAALDTLIQSLDLNIYADLLVGSYQENWRNATGNVSEETAPKNELDGEEDQL